MSKNRSKKKGKVEQGYTFSNTTRKRMSEAHTGKKLSPETKAKISAARREREAMIKLGFFKPYRHTEETKKKLSKIMKRRKHRPSKEARKRSANERSNRGKDRKILRDVSKGKL